MTLFRLALKSANAAINTLVCPLGLIVWEQIPLFRLRTGLEDIMRPIIITIDLKRVIYP